jgi:RNA polymerase sigma factor (sigma-70 family)
VIRPQSTYSPDPTLQHQFREAYDRYAKRLYNTALRIVGQEQDAEDVLQESFLDAFRNLQSFEGRASMGTWLHRIVVNRSVNLLKSRKLILTDAEPEIPVDPHSDEDAADLTLQVEQIRKAVMALPTGYRTVLSLHLFEGYDHEEIASILGIAHTSARSQYHRARNALLKFIRQKD